MKPGLKIGLKLFGINTFDVKQSGNIQGDEVIARGWQKYLLRREEVDYVILYGAEDTIEEQLDVLIHFNPWLPIQSGIKNIFYLQNAFPRAKYPGGVTQVFEEVKSKFDGYLFTSKRLMKNCADGGVIPFATDPEVFYPQPSPLYKYPVAFVGNNIRGEVTNERYFIPAIPFGLVIYGNPNWLPPLDQLCRGKLPMPDLPKLYSSCAINLNSHIPEHIEWDTVNLRIYDILACGGFVLSDYVDSLVQEFGHTVVCTRGHDDEWAKLVHYLSDSEARQNASNEGRQLVINHHTYANRVDTLITYLRELI